MYAGIARMETEPDVHWLHFRRLPANVPQWRRDLYLLPMLFGNLRIALSPLNDRISITEFYCYPSASGRDAWGAAVFWDGQGDPPGPWIRHVPSTRRREFTPDGELVREWLAP